MGVYTFLITMWTRITLIVVVAVALGEAFPRAQEGYAYGPPPPEYAPIPSCRMIEPSRPATASTHLPSRLATISPAQRAEPRMTDRSSTVHGITFLLKEPPSN